mgnify:FL=1
MQGERASKKQQELLSFVDGFIKGNGYGPSYREIMRALGYKSVSTVAIHTDGLIAKGYLARRDNSARSLEVVTTRLDAANHELPDDIEQKLIHNVKSLELSNEHKQVVKQALHLLGYEKAADSIAVSDDDTKPTNS